MYFTLLSTFTINHFNSPGYKGQMTELESFNTCSSNLNIRSEQYMKTVLDFQT